MTGNPEDEPAIEDERAQHGRDMCADQRAKISGGAPREEPEEQYEPHCSDRGVHPAHDQKGEALVPDQPKQWAGNAFHSRWRTDLRVVARKGIDGHGATLTMRESSTAGSQVPPNESNMPPTWLRTSDSTSSSRKQGATPETAGRTITVM